jgi:hypothetical protein
MEKMARAGGRIPRGTSKIFKNARDNGNRSQRFQDCLHCAIDCYCKRKEEDYEGAEQNS